MLASLRGPEEATPAGTSPPPASRRKVSDYVRAQWAVAEAAACGLPVLISDKVSIWRELEADGAGLVAPYDLSGTSRLLSGWLEMPEDARRQMRDRARKCFASRCEIGR